MPFTQNSLNFLVENHLQNSRTWFAEHKLLYMEYVLQPMQELVVALSPTMLKIDPGFITEPRVDRTISRIYRDVRFSKDKSLYRDNCWFTFARDKKLHMRLPSYWFEVNPGGFGYGMGYHQTSAQSMESIRKMIVNEDKLFKKAWTAYKKQNLFTLEGDMYKRSRYPGQPEEIKNLLDRKAISFNHYSTNFDLLFSQQLADNLKHSFEILAPLYQFLNAAEMSK